MSGSGLIHRFDWYQATVPCMPAALYMMLQRGLPDEITPIIGKGLNSFKERTDYTDLATGEIYATVMHGGVNPHPNITGKGDHGHQLAHWLRGEFPEHRVSRADICIDFAGPDAFAQTCEIMSAVGEYYHVSGERIVPERSDDGSTHYLGSRASPLRVRCYEKGKQLYKMTGDVLWREHFDWTRLELQVRPQKKFKSEAALLAPEEFWGCSRWTQQLARQALALDVEAVDMKPTPIADRERAMRFLVHQYGNTIEQQVKHLGSWQAFCDDLRKRLEGRNIAEGGDDLGPLRKAGSLFDDE